MEEFQIWSIWSSNRIGSGLIGIGSILGVWLSMRIAVASRNSNESNLFSKIISGINTSRLANNPIELKDEDLKKIIQS